MTDDDRMIATYRTELLAEAELARTDLDEIEDHLRALATELRAAGMPRAEAIAEACRRLGEPRELAREHARVRSPFGAKLSRARAWSAAALLLPYAVVEARFALDAGLASLPGVELGLVLLVMVALIARITWARPIILGALAVALTWTATILVTTWSPIASKIVLGACGAGAMAFLVPWRRGELTPAGAALALLAPSYMGAATAMSFYVTAPGGVVFANPVATIATVAVIVAGIGVVLRARWAALAAALGALALAGTAHGFWPLVVRMPHGEMWRALIVGSMVAGAITAAIAAMVCWRTARSAFGTLRHVLD